MYRILSVDDEPINQMIVEELLGDHYDVHLASSGEECLKTIDDIQPELILLDVSMSGMDGYSTSLLLKEKENTKHIPVIFVSARSTLEDKINGYKAGGHDYITKPFDHNELTIKINQLINHSAKNTVANTGDIPKHLLENDRSILDANHSTADLLPMAGEFLHNTFNCHSPEELADLLLASCKNFSLNCTLQIRTETTTLNRSSCGQVTPLEVSLFEGALSKDHFFDFGTHTITSYPHISLLTNNLSGEGSGRYKEVKYLLDILMAGTESRLIAINHSDSLQNTNSQL